MAKDEFDPFAPSTGLADDFDADIIGAEFGYRSSYNNGDTALLILTLQSTDGTVIGRDGETETEVVYACGNSWEVTDKGERVQREDGKRMGFNKQSAIWSFIENVMQHDGGKLRKAGDPMSAAGYRTLGGFHWKRIPYKTVGGEEKMRLVPVGPSTTSKIAADGGKSAAKAEKAAEKKAPAKAAAKKNSGDDGEDNGGLSAAVRAKLLMIAKRVKGEGGDHEAFVGAVFSEVEDADTDAAITAAVLDDGEGSVWAKAGE